MKFTEAQQQLVREMFPELYVWYRPCEGCGNKQQSSLSAKTPTCPHREGTLILESAGADIPLTFENLQKLSEIMGTKLIDIVSTVDHGYYGEVDNRLEIRFRSE